MKVKHVTTMQVVDGGDCYKLAFPMHGCTHAPADAEAVAAVEAELRKLDRKQHERVLRQMETAGSYPVKLDSEKPVPAKVEAVPERSQLQTSGSGKSGR